MSNLIDFKYKSTIKIIFSTLLIIFKLGLQAETGNNIVKFTGNMAVYSDFYDMNADPNNAIKPRRPASFYRFVFNPAISYGELYLPFSFSFSNNETSTTTPTPSKPSFLQYLTNPINSFSIKPEYKFIQLLIGTHVPRYSDLSTGNQKIFGGGFALTPGKFRLSFSSGVAKEVIDPDVENDIEGSYKRNFYSIKIGYGDEKLSHLHLNFMKASDEINSIKEEIDKFPEEGFVTSLQMRLNLPAGIYFKSEVAGSGFTRNMKADKLEVGPSKSLSPILENRESTRYDAAGSVEFGKKGRVWEVITKGKYYGPGFKSLAYPFLQSDRIEVSLEPRIRLIQNRVMLNGTISHRVNNLSETKTAKATQTLGLVNINARITSALNLAVRFSNFSFDTDEESDTLKIENVATSYSISPSYNFKYFNINHNVSASFSQDIYDDKNKISGSMSDNSSQNIVLSYNMSLLQRPFSSTISYSNYTNDLSAGDLVINSVNTSFSYSFFRNKLRSALRFGFTESKTEDHSADQNMTSGVTINYRITKQIVLNLNGSMNLYDFGSQRPGTEYTENLLRTSIKYNF
ncbi:hypothetical protein ACFLYK_04545 [Candidatus Cloacimonadota bacterium]